MEIDKREIKIIEHEMPQLDKMEILRIGECYPEIVRAVIDKRGEVSSGMIR